MPSELPPWKGKKERTSTKAESGWWSQICLEFSSQKVGKVNPFWRAYFSKELKQPASEWSLQSYHISCPYPTPGPAERHSNHLAAKGRKKRAVCDVGMSVSPCRSPVRFCMLPRCLVLKGLFQYNLNYNNTSMIIVINRYNTVAARLFLDVLSIVCFFDIFFFGFVFCQAWKNGHVCATSGSMYGQGEVVLRDGSARIGPSWIPSGKLT